MIRYFNIPKFHFEIPKYRSFCDWSFQMLTSTTPTRKFGHCTFKRSLIFKFEMSAILKFYCSKFQPSCVVLYTLLDFYHFLPLHKVLLLKSTFIISILQSSILNVKLFRYTNHKMYFFIILFYLIF